MEEIYKNILLLVNSLTRLSGTTYIFKEDPSKAKADKIADMVDKCESKFLKVKEEIVKMMDEVENDNEIAITAVQTENGYLIKEQ